MKQDKYYTFILSSSSLPTVRKIHIRAKTLKWAFGLFCLMAGLTLFVISDYFHMASEQIQLQEALDEKNELKKKFYTLESELHDLNKEFVQLRDFNRKIRTITLIGQDSSLQTQNGRMSLSHEILASGGPSSTNPSILPVTKTTQHTPTAREIQKLPTDFSELMIQIRNLKKKTKLVKQNTWQLYSSLLKRKEILNSTPSIFPTKGWVTSHFGYRNETFYADHDLRFHKGMDIAAEWGSPVFASASGQVVYSGYDDTGYGKVVIIDHGYNIKTVYAHMSEIKAQKGEYVKRGRVIGQVGNTGKSTGPHLHYEIQISGVPVNPANYILNEDFPIARIGGKNPILSVY